MEIKPIRMTINAGLDHKDDALASLNGHLQVAAEAVQAAYRERYAGAASGGDRQDAIALLAVVADFLTVMSRLDDEYGADSVLPIEDTPDAVDEALGALLELESWLIRLDVEDRLADLHAVEIGIGYWAMRHGVAVLTVEPITNALAAKSNAATSTQETAAVYAMMQGFIGHFLTGLGADLERSNPQRPWRLLNLNFAITAIRTGDTHLMRYAFDTLNSHLPDERAGFYEEAHALACQPGFPAPTRALIETELARWTRAH